jgi:hypothetical protein
MAGLVPAIHVFDSIRDQDVDARDISAFTRVVRRAMRGHDESLLRVVLVFTERIETVIVGGGQAGLAMSLPWPARSRARHTRTLPRGGEVEKRTVGFALLSGSELEHAAPRFRPSRAGSRWLRAAR